MAATSFLDVKKAVKAGTYSPVYLFHGEEPYYIDEAVKILEHDVLTEAEKGFNLLILYGRDSDAQTIVDNAMRYPMFSERQVVLVKEAQQLKDIEKLLSYIEKAQPSTLLVLAYKYKKYPANRKLYKAIAKKGVIFESKKIRDYKVSEWVQNYLKGKPYTINMKASLLIQEYLGTDLSKVSGELDKLFLNLSEGTEITDTHIEQFIGISKDYNIFELNNAMMQGDTDRVWRIVEYFRANPKNHPLVMITANLYSMFSKIYQVHFVAGGSDKELASALHINPFFIKDYRTAASNYSISRLEQVFAELLTYDLRSKGVGDSGTPQSELLREMIWKILP
ncbi:MAG: DNA polymerase-3 subunit delta [Limisphaerales bacterium]|jgi:DNA polymerase-3 subunit delta